MQTFFRLLQRLQGGLKKRLEQFFVRTIFFKAFCLRALSFRPFYFTPFGSTQRVSTISPAILMGMGCVILSVSTCLQAQNNERYAGFNQAPYGYFQKFKFADYTADQTNIGSITDIKQDKRGFLWVAGENGLARFDGHSVLLHRISEHNSIAANFVKALAVDNNHLWIATVAGISRLELDSGRVKTITAHQLAIPSNEVNDITRYKNWVFAATAQGLAVINAQNLKPEKPPFLAKLPADQNIQVAYIKDDILWLGTSHLGLTKINLITNQVQFYRPNPRDATAIPHHDVSDIYSHNGKDFWLASLGGGLIKFNAQSQKFIQYSAAKSADNPFITNDVRSLFGDSKGFVWVGTHGSGLWRIDLRTNNIEGYLHDGGDPGSIYSDKTRVVFEDRDNNIWVGNFSGVLDYHHRAFDHIQHVQKRNSSRSGLNDNAILTIHKSTQNTYWIGTEGGLDLFDPEKGSLLNFTSNPGGPLKASPVLALEQDGPETLWVGTWGGGLQRYWPSTGRWQSLFDHPNPKKRIPSAFIWALKKDNNGNLWVGTQTHGLYRLQLATGLVKHYPFSAKSSEGVLGEYIKDILLDSTGQLWLATLQGLSHYRPETDDFDVTLHDPTNANSLASNLLIGLMEHSNGDIWIATRSAGINIYNPVTKTFKNIGLEQGLPSPEVACMIEDGEGNVWAGTPSGLVKITLTNSAITLYRKANGLVGANFHRNACYFDIQGRVWVGSKEGLSIFKPEALEQTGEPMPVMLTGLRVNYGNAHGDVYWKAQMQAPIFLNYKQNALAFSFSLNHFYLTKFNEYRYRLKGMDNNWQTLQRGNSAIFTNLDPGHYTFEIKGKTANGRWSNTATAIHFTIAPPPWRQWWAYLIYVSIFAFIFAVYRNYMAVRARSLVYQQLSQLDPLTRLPNRLALNQRIEQWEAEHKIYSVIAMDLDYFKKVNDTYGHEAGDKVLKGFAKMAQSEIRDCDLLGRWGGEEFLILCDSAHLPTVKRIAERIINNLSLQEFLYHQQIIQITVSAGCALRRPDESFNELFHRADQALYCAKENGRNRVVEA